MLKRVLRGAGQKLKPNKNRQRSTANNGLLLVNHMLIWEEGVVVGDVGVKRGHAKKRKLSRLGGCCDVMCWRGPEFQFSTCLGGCAA